MTIGGRIATYTGSAVGIVLVVCLGLIKLSNTSIGPKPRRGKYIPPLAITLYVDNGQCKQKVEGEGGGQDNNFPEIYVGQSVTWTASQDWSLSFQNDTVFPPNTGSPFEDSNGNWQPKFSGTAANPTPSGSSALTFWEKLYYSYGTQQVPFKYNSITINNAPCLGASGMGLVVKPGG